MKRIKSMKILIIVLMAITLTGCADTLKCNIKTKNYESTIKITYKEEKPAKYVFKDKMFFSELSADSELYYHSKTTEYQDLINEKHARIRNKKTSVETSIKYDFTKDTSAQEGSLLAKRDETKSKTIKRIEDLGYKCK
jgi:hypothetical protein